LTVSAGQVPTAAEWNSEFLPGTVIKRGERTTSSTASTAAQGVLRVDGASLTAGRRYKVSTSSLTLQQSVTGDTSQVVLSMDTTGVAATTASSVYAVHRDTNSSTTLGAGCKLEYYYTPSSSQSVSVILWTDVISGAGTVKLLVAATTDVIQIEITDCGVDPGDTGVDL